MCARVRGAGVSHTSANVPRVTMPCVTVSRMTAAAVAAEATNGHSDQSDAPKGESGQVNVHALI